MALPLPAELALLGWSTVLLFAQVMLQGQLATRERGLGWNAGPRDGAQSPLGPLAGRAQRALDNFKETWPAFIALALGLAVSGRTGGIGAAGAGLWFAARLVYIPLYLAGVPYMRSLVWLVSLLGLLLMLVSPHHPTLLVRRFRQPRQRTARADDPCGRAAPGPLELRRCCLPYPAVASVARPRAS